MKTIDFSFMGGFPLNQDRLNDMQQAYIDMGLALAAGTNGTTNPKAVAGMKVSGGGNTVSSGSFVYNGELIHFTGGTVTPIGGEVALVLIETATTSLTYNDGSTHPAINNKTARLIAAATVTDATHFPVSSLDTLLPKWVALDSYFPTNIEPYVSPLIYKDRFGIVNWRGSVKANLDPSAIIIDEAVTPLPAQYRPNTDINIPCTAWHSITGAFRTVNVLIGPTGTVSLDAAEALDNDEVLNLDPIRYYVE